MLREVMTLVVCMLRGTRALFRSRESRAIVELALRQQLAVYVHRHPRPRLLPLDRAFWVTLSRYLPETRLGEDPRRRWITFLRNYRDSIAGMDFFVVPAVQLELLYVLILDNDSIFSPRVVRTISSFGMKPQRTALRSPWQNGTAERFVGSVRRELIDHVVV